MLCMATLGQCMSYPYSTLTVPSQQYYHMIEFNSGSYKSTVFHLQVISPIPAVKDLGGVHDNGIEWVNTA